ncbi:hypothetical protein HLB44_20740 [Aquincola sp. S2]|uniref:Uncharacterized protein n=1 Tax=Pseudaquabacterium terrae TaxID=2732868 RepID=A0ABX2EL98_9BURK|nr:hypothetical protein [Aquabacterium terrae]NRF69432.1 hypothetical protein [Aquabacterium terrae]
MLLLAGCANAPASLSPATTPAQVPAQPSLQELMQQAQSALQANQRERARQSWRAAARAYPTQKAPWQRLAEDYFDSADYGNAILAAQEVLQRDGQDTLAHSVLAVSGLRLSTVSLVALRERSSYPVGSRDEALGLARAMREALGEVTLVPPVRAEGPVAARPAPAAHTNGATRQLSAPAAARAPAAVVPVATQSPVTPRPAAAPTATARPAPAPAPAPAAAKTNDPFKLLN